MTETRLFRTLSRVVEVKPGEELIALLLFFYFFLITAPFGIIKAVRNAQYLISLEAKNLPLAYLLTAVLMGFVVALHTKLQFRIPRAVLLMSSLIFFLVTCLLFMFVFRREVRPDWIPLPFWIWANIFITVLMTQFWILVNDIFNPREYKRLNGFFVSGGILGGILGGLLTGFLGREIPLFLLGIASILLLANIFVVNAIFRWEKRRTPRSVPPPEDVQKTKRAASKMGFADSFATVRKNYYLKLLAAVVALTLIISTFIDWQSKQIFEIKIDHDDLTTFFGFLTAGLLVLALILELLMSSSLIRRFGIRFTLLVYPLILVVCFFGIAVSPGILFAVLIKGSDKSLSFSLNQSVRELLYIPISSEFKYKAKVFIDMFINRFAKGLGALILLIFLAVFPIPDTTPPKVSLPATASTATEAPSVAPEPVTSEVETAIMGPETWKSRVRFMSYIAILFILAWIYFNLKISKEYTNTVKQQLEMKWERADKIVDEKLDVDFMKLVIDTLEHKDRSSVLYAMDIFDLIKQDKLTPEVKKLISYKQAEVRASSLGTLIEGGEPGLIPEMGDFLSDEVLGQEVEEIMSLDVYQTVMQNYFDKVLVEKDSKADLAKMEVARAIGLMAPQSTLVDRLEDLLAEESPDVIRYAVESAAKLKKREYVPALVRKLGSRPLREDAATALIKFGSKIIGTLSDFLADRRESIDLRRGVSSVIARVGTQEAADFLLMELAHDDRDIRTDLIDALDRIRSNNPAVVFPKELVNTVIGKCIQEYYQTFLKVYTSPDNKEDYDLGRGLPKDLSSVLSDIFKLKGLIYPQEDIVKAYQNLREGAAKAVAYAVELLDNILPKDLRDVFFPLIEDMPLRTRIERCRLLLDTASVFKKGQ